MFREHLQQIFSKFTYETHIVAECKNPNSMRSAVGFTYLRNGPNQISPNDLNDAIRNAKGHLQTCSPDCSVNECQLKYLSTCTPEQLYITLYDDHPKE